MNTPLLDTYSPDGQDAFDKSRDETLEHLLCFLQERPVSYDGAKIVAEKVLLGYLSGWEELPIGVTDFDSKSIFPSLNQYKSAVSRLTGIFGSPEAAAILATDTNVAVSFAMECPESHPHYDEAAQVITAYKQNRRAGKSHFDSAVNTSRFTAEYSRECDMDVKTLDIIDCVFKRVYTDSWSPWN